MNFGTRIAIRYKVALLKNVAAEDVSLVITESKENVLETIEVAGDTNDSKGRYVANFCGSTSKDMRRVACVTA